ncbi:hypothetical protein D3C77_736820 [compost metagenome]
MLKSNTSASTTPPNSTYSVGRDSAGITRSYTCMENSTPARASTLATSEATITCPYGRRSRNTMRANQWRS